MAVIALDGTNSRSVRLAPGYTLEAPGLVGRMNVVNPQDQAIRAASGLSETALAAALERADLTIRTLFELDISADRGTGGATAPQTRSTGEPAITLRAPAIGPTFGQAVLYSDEAGMLQWIFPDAPVALDGNRGGAEVRFQLPRARVMLDASSPETQQRGTVIKLARRVVRVVLWATDALIGEGAQAVARTWEQQSRPYGWQLLPFANRDAIDWTWIAGGRTLVLIHDIFSSAEATFGLLPSNTLAELLQLYDGRVIAFNHPTLSASPSDNVEQLLATLPRNLQIDIIAYGRGGLVARDLIRRIDSEIPLNIGKLILIAVPNEGTLLANSDHWLLFINRYINLSMTLPESIFTELFPAIGTFIKIIGHAFLQSLPGLEAMLPGYTYLHDLNANPISTDRVFAIATDYQSDDPGWVSHYLTRIGDKLIDSIFNEPNDGIIPIAGSYSVNNNQTHWEIPSEQRLILRSNHIHHNAYFQSSEVCSQLVKWLQNPSVRFQAYASLVAPAHIGSEESVSVSVGFSDIPDPTLELGRHQMVFMDVQPTDTCIVLLQGDGITLDQPELTLSLLMNANVTITGTLTSATGTGTVRLRADYYFRQVLIGQAEWKINVDDSAVDLLVTVRRNSEGQLVWTAVCRDVDIAPLINSVSTESFSIDDARLLTADVMAEAEKSNATTFAVLEALGAEIAALVPQPIWDIQTTLATRSTTPLMVLLKTDEPFIPWELALLPQPLDSLTSPFWAAQTCFGRWIDSPFISPLPPHTTMITRITAVASQYGGISSGQPALPNAVKERDVLGEHWHAITLLAMRKELETFQISEPIPGHLLHFAGHSEIILGTNEQYLLLSDRTKLSPGELVPRQIRGQPPHFSIVFLNCADVGGSNFPGIILQSGTSGFLGPLWRVNDEEALRFATYFYEQTLGQGEAIGTVLYNYRRTYQPMDSTTPLAYIWYGHPGLRMQFQHMSILREQALSRIQLVQGDLLQQTVDAIVHAVGRNPANAGSIGEQLVELIGVGFLQRLYDQSTLNPGETFISPATPLAAKYIIHVASEDEEYQHSVQSTLRAVKGALLQAEQLKDVRTLALPAIGDGAGIAPNLTAGSILEIVVEHLMRGSHVEHVSFVFTNDAAYQAYRTAYNHLVTTSSANQQSPPISEENDLDGENLKTLPPLMVYFTEPDGWQINRGTIHGLPSRDTAEVAFKILASLDGATLGEARTRKVGERISQVEVTVEADQLDPTISYPAQAGMLFGHTASLEAVAVTPNGRLIITGSMDTTLKIWDMQTCDLVNTLTGHTGPVWGAVISPDGSRVVSASGDWTMRVWNIETGSMLVTCVGHTAAVFAVAITSDGRIISGSDDHTVRVWDSESGEMLASFAGHTAGVWAVTATPDGDMAVSGSEDHTLIVWDLQTGTAQHTLRGHTGIIRHIAVTPDGRSVISSSEDGTLKMWNLATGTQERTFATDKAGFTGVAVTPDGQLVIAGTQNGKVTVWDATTGVVLKTFTGHHDAVYRIAVSPDGRTAISASHDTTARFWPLPVQPIKTELPEGIWLGARDLGAGRVSFALYAPWKQSVHLIGSFNNWDQTADALAVSEQGIWWIIKELPEGEHEYQFVLDGETVIGDPYARELRWGNGGQPNAVISTAGSAYEWNDGGFGIKPLNELVIYEIHVGDFSPEGTFKGVTERLPYLRELGVSAIELMPIFEFPGDMWGYNPAYFFAPDTSYGTLDDLHELIDVAHQHGIGVLLDMVFNHIDGSSPISYLYPYDDSSYFSSDGNPWGFPNLNYWNDAVKQFLADVQTYWLTEMHIDGFRYDYTSGIGYDGENGLSFLTWQARQVKPHIYLIAENTDDYTSMVLNTEVDASWHIDFRYQMSANLRGGDFNGKHYGDLDETMRRLDFRATGYTDNAQAINFLESHDEQRLFYDLASNPNIQPDTAHQKSKLGAIALFTAAGVPMLYQGQEFGMWTERTIDQNKLQWDLLQNAQGGDLHAFYRGMAQLRLSCRALVGNNIVPLVLDHERKMLTYYRWSDDQNSHVVVVLNFGSNTEKLDVPFPRGGVWHEWVDNDDRDIAEGVSSTEIAASSGKIFVFDSADQPSHPAIMTHTLEIILPPRNTITVGETVSVVTRLVAEAGPVALPAGLDEVHCAISPADTLMHLGSPNLAAMTRRPDGTFAPLAFELQAKLPGEHSFTIDLYINDPQTGRSMLFQSQPSTISIVPPDYLAPPAPPPPLDVQVGQLPPFLLHVDTQLLDGSAGHQLTYRLSSRVGSQPLRLADAGTCYLASSAILRLQALLATARRRAAAAAPSDAQAILRSFGAYLYDLLFPSDTAAAFRQHFWLSAEAITSWLIVEDGSIWLPWDLVAPYQPGQPPRCLGERYELSRWVHGLGATLYSELAIGDLVLVPYETEATKREHPRAWARLLNASLTDDIGIVADPRRPIYGLHLLRAVDATTGREIMPLGSATTPEETRLRDQTLNSRLDLQRKRPLITLSMLRGAAPSPDDSEWLLPERVLPFLRTGASVVVGSWWPTCAAADRIFWSTFYDQLGLKVALGVALRLARQAVAQALPGHPDALAYTAFGNPRARPYEPEISDGYTVLECLDFDTPLRPHKAYTFRASVRLLAPDWHQRRLVQVQELPEQMKVIFMAPNLQPAFPEPLAMELVNPQMLAATIRMITPGPGTYRLNAEFLQDDEYLKTMQLTLTVADEEAGDAADE